MHQPVDTEPVDTEPLDHAASAPLSTSPNSIQPSKARRYASLTAKAIFACVALFGADTARVILTSQKPDTHAATNMYYPSLSSMKNIPGPDTEIETLLQHMHSFEDVATFLKTHAEYRDVKTPWTFLGTYRMSPEELQQQYLDDPEADKWLVNCNSSSELYARAASLHGVPVSLVAMSPTVERIVYGTKSDTKKHRLSCHLIAVHKRRHPDTGASQYVIGDNNNVVYWDGTLEEYANTLGMTILPAAGVVDYQQESAHWRCEFWGQLSPNEAVEDPPPVINEAA